jgi:hypothetical protein
MDADSGKAPELTRAKSCSTGIGREENGWGPSKHYHDQNGMGKQKGDSSSKEKLGKWSHAKHKLENSAPAAPAGRLPSPN